MNQAPTKNFSFTIDRCCARLVTNPNKQCKFKPKINGFCKRHYAIKGTLTTIFDSHSPNRKPTQKIDNTSLILIQKRYRGHYIRTFIKEINICCFARHLCNNITDCMEFVDIVSISNRDFIGYKEADDLYWGFHVNTLNNVINNTQVNPYNLKEFPTEFLKNFKNIYEESKTPIILKLPPHTHLQQKCVEIFQIIDNLDNYTKCNWFLDLNIRKLKHLYKYFEDMWNYRLGLSLEDKKKYINETIGINPFIFKVADVFKWSNYYKIAHLILDIFKRFVTEGQTRSDNNTASKWILSSLTLVHQDASLTCPWLFQAAYF